MNYHDSHTSWSSKLDPTSMRPPSQKPNKIKPSTDINNQHKGRLGEEEGKRKAIKRKLRRTLRCQHRKAQLGPCVCPDTHTCPVQAHAMSGPSLRQSDHSASQQFADPSPHQLMLIVTIGHRSELEDDVEGAPQVW